MVMQRSRPPFPALVYWGRETPAYLRASAAVDLETAADWRKAAARRPRLRDFYIVLARECVAAAREARRFRTGECF